MVALGNEEMHGYAIMQEARRRTEGQRRLAPGTLYRSLKHMYERGIMAESEGAPSPAATTSADATIGLRTLAGGWL